MTYVINVRYIIDKLRKGGERVKVTTRIIADVEPSTKEKLKKLADQKGERMTIVLTKLINYEYDFHFGEKKK